MFAVGFEIVDEELKKALGDKGKGKGFETEDDNQESGEPIKDTTEKVEKVEISDDID